MVGPVIQTPSSLQLIFKTPPSSFIWTFFPVKPRLFAATAVAQEEDPDAKVTPTPHSQTRILIWSGAVIDANCTFVRSGNRW